MEKNYYIKSNYKPNKENKTFETGEIKYWINNRIHHSLYSRPLLYKCSKKLIKKKNLKSVLDIGCGPAVKLMKYIYPICHDIYGIDQENIIKFCKNKYGLKNFFIDNIEKSTLNLKKRFDLIISGDVIEHLLNPDNLLNYIKKFSHENTYILITTPERDILRGENCNSCSNPSHIREWNKQEFNNYLKKNGFEIIYHTVIDSLRLYLNFKQRLTEIGKDLSIKLSLIKKFNTLKKIKHSQLVVCKLKHLNDFENNSIKRICEKCVKSNSRDGLNRFIIKSYLILLKLHKLGKK